MLGGIQELVYVDAHYYVLTLALVAENVPTNRRTLVNCHILFYVHVYLTLTVTGERKDEEATYE